jgi:chromate reductase
MDIIKTGVFTGSLRRESFSAKTAAAISALMPENFIMKKIDIGGLPLFNQDFDDDGNIPLSWTAFREEVRMLDALLFVTPEYNRSYPAVLKNALDIASRPAGQNIWGGKPGALISVTPGKLGGFGSNQHLRQVMGFLDIPLLRQPEAYISNAASLFGGEGELIDDGTRGFLRDFAIAFARWVERVLYHG